MTWFPSIHRPWPAVGLAAALIAAPSRAADVPCAADSNRRVDAQGKVSACLLSDDARFGPYTCAKGKIARFHPDGALKECYLTEAKVIQGISCKDALSLTPKGALRRCRTTAPAKVGAVEHIPAGSWITLYESGALRRLEVPRPTQMMGLPCKGFLNFFHENGKLMKCQLAEDREIAKTVQKAGTFVCWDNADRPVAGCKMLGRELFE